MQPVSAGSWLQVIGAVLELAGIFTVGLGISRTRSGSADRPWRAIVGVDEADRGSIRPEEGERLGFGVIQDSSRRQSGLRRSPPR